MKLLNFLLLLLIFYCHTTDVTAQINYDDYSLKEKKVLFADNFNDNKNKWITDNKWISGQISKGFYTISDKDSPGAGISYITSALDYEKDFEIEGFIKITKGRGSIMWGMNEKFQHYRFDLDSKLYILYQDPVPSPKKNLTQGYINAKEFNSKGFNKLTIRKVNDKIYLFINEKFMNQVDYLQHYGKQIGFVVDNAEMQVDYLKISYLKKLEIVLPDTSPPVITILNPEVKKNEKVYHTSKEILIQGNAADSSGIYEVTVNGYDTDVKAKGDFRKSVRLAFGENRITVQAIDTKNNASTFTFYITRITETDTAAVEQIDFIPEAPEEKRLALVIGNARYEGGQKLKNPVNDAELMATTLQDLGFEVIISVDAGKKRWKQP
jgi:hypothetical protein